MKLRSLILASVVLAALAGTLYWSEHRKPSDEAPKTSDAAPAILKLDEASISKVEIKKLGVDPVVLAKGSSGAWQITAPKAYAADQSNVSSTLSSLSSLNSERVVDEKPANLKQFGLAPPAVEVNVTEKDNKTQQLLLGDDTPTGSATYVMLAGNPRIFTVASYNRNSIAKSLNDFRDKRLLPVSADQVARLDIIRKNQTIEFGRNKEEWQILQPKPMRADSTQVGDLVQKLTDARMNLGGSEPNATETPAAFGAGTQFATAKTTDPSGSQELQIKKIKNNYYAKSTAVEGIHKISADLAQALDKNVDDFRNKKLFDFGFADPDKVEIHAASKTFSFTRTVHDWWSNGKKMDVDTIGALLSNVREMSADKFVDSGFTAPTVEVSVTWQDGKQVEKISMMKSDDGYVAKRENDPTLYHVQSATVDTVEKSAEDVKPAAAPAK
jgi:hypothetical protein